MSQIVYSLIITLTNVDRFSKLFHQLIRRKIIYIIYIDLVAKGQTTKQQNMHTSQRFPRHLQSVATLLCGHFEDLITNQLMKEFCQSYHQTAVAREPRGQGGQLPTQL